IIPEPVLHETIALNQKEQTVRTQTIAWWQPAVDWMIHGNPILRVAVAVLMVGIVLLLRFASEHWQMSLGVKLGYNAIAGGVLTAFGYTSVTYTHLRAYGTLLYLACSPLLEKKKRIPYSLFIFQFISIYYHNFVVTC
ncbi:hypothetical protein, partial [Acinetobacter baumannii]|uniref:hypothetical protein n=1 Tax=Acinetobacter baumannii TaxID=470 RepID=UPI001D178F2A